MAEGDLYDELGVTPPAPEKKKKGSTDTIDLYGQSGVLAPGLWQRMKEGIPDADKFDFWRWLRTRAVNAGAGTATMAHELNQGVGERLTQAADVLGVGPKAFGASPDTAKTVANIAAYNPLTYGASELNPFTVFGGIKMPTKDEVKDFANRTFGIQDVNSPASWGTTGKMLDTGTDIALSALMFPGGGATRAGTQTAARTIPTILRQLPAATRDAVVTAARNPMSVVRATAGSPQGRSVLPAFTAGAASEGVGDIEAIKDTPYELPLRTLAGVTGGLLAGGTQNILGNVTQGGRNLLTSQLASSVREAQEQAYRILGRHEASDAAARQPGQLPGMPPPPPVDPLTRFDAFAPGTPYVATAGENVQGAVRGAIVPQGPARQIVREGNDAFIEGSNTRVEPAINRISTLPTAEVQRAQLEAQASANAPPLYRAAGVADDPQAILTQRAGAPINSTEVGPDFLPVTVQHPGPPVTVATSPSQVLQSPALRQYMEESGPIQSLVRNLRGDPAYRHLDLTDMAVVDQVYKDLVKTERSANRATDGGVAARHAGNQRRALLELIEAENPTYARALRAHADPMSLADAADEGARAAGSNVSRDSLRMILDGLESDAHRERFLGGYAGALQGKADVGTRATAADRMNLDRRAREKLEMVMEQNVPGGTTGPGGPWPGMGPSEFPLTDRLLQNERRAGRAMRKVTTGSDTLPKTHEVSDIAGGDSSGVVADVIQKGAIRTALEKIGEKSGAIAQRVTEGRNQQINEAIANYAMTTDRAEVARNVAMVQRAREVYERTQAARRRALEAGGGAGVLSGLLAP